MKTYETPVKTYKKAKMKTCTPPGPSAGIRPLNWAGGASGEGTILHFSYFL